MKRIAYLMLAGMAMGAIALQGGMAPANANEGPAGATWYANSPSGLIDKKHPLGADTTVNDTGTPLRKFVDSLPGVGPTHANNLGQYIPLAVADTATYGDADYYHIGIVEYTEKVHSDLPKATRFRGYRDLMGAGQPAHYLGPLILAKRDRPVRLLVDNLLPINTDPTGGKLFIPVDTLMMGAGFGPDGSTIYSENRATVHLHGGFTPWISDGTPHQWFTPAGEANIYTEGASFQDVPDMPNPGHGSTTHYYTNAQSNRLMFYHEHALGITRLGVYVGLAAPYVIWDTIEDDLIMGTNNSGFNVNPDLLKILPDQGGDPFHKFGIPLVIQDRTFVPKNIALQDNKWTDAAWGQYGDLWFPHIYEPNQDPNATDNTGASQFGRWDYGPWFWPPSPVSANPQTATEYKYMPGMSDGHVDPRLYDRSAVPEAFMDTMMVNGTVYPYLVVAPMAYRFRILNACNDRYLNLQMYKAVQQTEVKMMNAVYNKGLVKKFPNLNLPVDGRAGGIPHPNLGGPNFIQIGTEGGFLPAPVVIQNQPVNYEYNRRNIVVLNVTDKALYMGPAERADVIVDFTKFSGQTIVLYNDAPAPMPGYDPRNDYYTGNPDFTSTGGAPSTKRGYGPNTRTIMVFKVKGKLPKGVKRKVFDLAALQAVWPAVYVADQPPPIVPQTAYPGAYQAATDTYSRIQDNSLTFTPVGGGVPITMNMEPKAIQELFDEYGRMNSTLGAELPFTNIVNQTTIPLKYIDPPNEEFVTGQPQLWKITHNGVDTHAVHFHLFNVQLINRVGWDGAITPPEPNEQGWKETVRMNPLEDIIVAMKADIPPTPTFVVPESNRLLDPTWPAGAPKTPVSQFTDIDPQTGQPFVSGPVQNVMTNFGWEYVWHCHLLGHEENDMMRPIVVRPPAP